MTAPVASNQQSMRIRSLAPHTLSQRRTRSDAKDLTGETFTRWEVVKRAANVVEKSGKTRSMWWCRCSCGNLCRVRTQSLLNGLSGSCGCLKREIALRTITQVQANRNRSDAR